MIFRILLTVFIPIAFNAVSYETFFVENLTPARYQEFCNNGTGIPCIEDDVDPTFEYTAHDDYHVYMVIIYVPFPWNAAIFFPWGGCLKDQEKDLYCVDYNEDRTGFIAYRHESMTPYDVVFVDER